MSLFVVVVVAVVVFFVVVLVRFLCIFLLLVAVVGSANVLLLPFRRSKREVLHTPTPPAIGAFKLCKDLDHFTNFVNQCSPSERCANVIE